MSPRSGKRGRWREKFPLGRPEKSCSIYFPESSNRNFRNVSLTHFRLIERSLKTKNMGTCLNYDKYRTMAMDNSMFIIFATGAGVRVVEIQAIAFQAKLVL